MSLSDSNFKCCRKSLNLLVYERDNLIVLWSIFQKTLRGLSKGSILINLGYYMIWRLYTMDFFFDVSLFFGWAFVLNIGVVRGIRFVHDSVRLIIIRWIHQIIILTLVFMFVCIVFNNKLNIRAFHYISQIILVITFNRIRDYPDILWSNICWYILRKHHFPVRG